MNDSQKIEELLHHFRMEQKEFAEKCGILPNTISNIKIGEHGISKKVFNQILKSFPEVNRNWLLDGEGEMLKKSQKTDNVSITKLDEDNQSGKLIPFYDDVRTIGGGGGSNLYYSGESTQNPTDYINTGGWFNNATGAIRHYGDSMIEYPPGCILALKEVQDFRLIIPGKDYVIETDEYRVTKKVRLQKDCIMAYSSNEEKYDDGELIHQPFPIPFELLRRVFEVLGYIVKKSSGTMVYDNKDKRY